MSQIANGLHKEEVLFSFSRHAGITVASISLGTELDAYWQFSRKNEFPYVYQGRYTS